MPLPSNAALILGRTITGATPKGIRPWWWETKIAAQPASLHFKASCTESTPLATNGTLPAAFTYSLRSESVTGTRGIPSTTSYFPSVPGTWSMSTPTAIAPCLIANWISSKLILWSANGLMILTVLAPSAAISAYSSLGSIPTQFTVFSFLAARAYSNIGFLPSFNTLFRCEKAGIIIGESNSSPKITVFNVGSTASITRISTWIESK